MRQGQQNRRGRGRSSSSNNNQNRKGQNPLTRSFESTGPDVKIRGTPAHIAEKYMMLARDAQSSGDPVLAENYHQHAEHYTRIIMAFREQQISQGGDMSNGGMPRQASMGDDFSDDEGDDMGPDPHGQPSLVRGNEPQPRSFEGQRFDDRGQRTGQDTHRPAHHHRDRPQGEQRGFSDRHERPDRSDRSDRYQRPERPERPERYERPAQQGEPAAEGGQQPRRDGMVPHHEQPEFLRRPVRRPRRDGNGTPADETAPATSTTVEDTSHE